jgi:hypothetical protein
VYAASPPSPPPSPPPLPLNPTHWCCVAASVIVYACLGLDLSTAAKSPGVWYSSCRCACMAARACGCGRPVWCWLQPMKNSCPSVGLGFVNIMPTTMTAGMKPQWTIGCARAPHGHAGSGQAGCVRACSRHSWREARRSCLHMERGDELRVVHGGCMAHACMQAPGLVCMAGSARQALLAGSLGLAPHLRIHRKLLRVHLDLLHEVRVAWACHFGPPVWLFRPVVCTGSGLWCFFSH